MTSLTSVTSLRGHLGVEAEHVTELGDLADPALQHGAPAVSATGTNINTGTNICQITTITALRLRRKQEGEGNWLQM